MMEDLARRAVASPHWRWLPGMALVRRKQGPAGGTGLRPTHLRVALTGGHPCDPFACIADVDRLPRPAPNDPHWVPDLTDPATVGCLLALVREAWGDPALSVTAGYTKDRTVEWEVEHPHPDSLPEALWTYFDTEAAALVAALEAAP